MRDELTAGRLRALVEEISRTAPREGASRVYLVGGGTAALSGWQTQVQRGNVDTESRSSSISMTDWPRHSRCPPTSPIPK